MPRARQVGRSIPLSLPRRFVADVVNFAIRTPSVAIRRRFSVAAVAAARQLTSPRIGWASVFLKAYGLVAAARPELRRCYLTWPWTRLYEHAENVAAVTVERQFEGEDSVFIALRSHPEQMTLPNLDAWLRSLKNAPLEDVPSFRRQLQLCRLPRPLRRLAWWLAWTAHGRAHAKSLGTFGLTSTAAAGALPTHVLSPLASTLSYGPIEPDGAVDVMLTFDHRVLDGAPAARALADLESALTGPVCEELRSLARQAA